MSEDKNLKPSKWYAVYKEARFHNDYLEDLENLKGEYSPQY